MREIFKDNIWIVAT
jgi:hypothetical protein